MRSNIGYGPRRSGGTEETRLVEEWVYARKVDYLTPSKEVQQTAGVFSCADDAQDQAAAVFLLAKAGREAHDSHSHVMPQAESIRIPPSIAICQLLH